MATVAASGAAKLLGGQLTELATTTGLSQLGRAIGRKINFKKLFRRGKRRKKTKPSLKHQPTYAYPATSGYGAYPGAYPTATAVPATGWSGFKARMATPQGRKDLAFAGGREIGTQLAVMGALTGGMSAYQNYKNDKKRKAENNNYGYDTGAGYDAYGSSGYGAYGSSLGGPSFSGGYGGGYGSLDYGKPTYGGYNGTPIVNDYALKYY